MTNEMHSFGELRLLGAVSINRLEFFTMFHLQPLFCEAVSLLSVYLSSNVTQKKEKYHITLAIFHVDCFSQQEGLI